MKKLLVIGLLLAGINSYGSECPVEFGSDNYLDDVQKIIKTKKSCSEASEIVEACAMGSSMDVQFVSAALNQCSKRINGSTSVKALAKTSNELCIKKYKKSEGTLAMSARAFCQLEVAKLFDNLLSPAEL